MKNGGKNKIIIHDLYIFDIQNDKRIKAVHLY